MASKEKSKWYYERLDDPNTESHDYKFLAESQLVFWDKAVPDLVDGLLQFNGLYHLKADYLTKRINADKYCVQATDRKRRMPQSALEGQPFVLHLLPQNFDSVQFGAYGCSTQNA